MGRNGERRGGPAGAAAYRRVGWLVVIRVVVDVMLKPEILDPQGQAIARALPRLGFEHVASVRQGKRFELELHESTEEAALAAAREIAETLLANTVIEAYSVRLDQPVRHLAESGDYDGPLTGMDSQADGSREDDEY